MRLPLLPLLPVLFLTACVSNPERDCGLYDFDCDSTPAGPALITPEPETPVTQAPRTPPAGTRTEDLATRVQLLEEETRRLRRRIETLEQAR